MAKKVTLILDNLVYTKENPVDIERLKELGAVEVEDPKEKVEKNEDKAKKTTPKK